MCTHSRHPNVSLSCCSPAVPSAIAVMVWSQLAYLLPCVSHVFLPRAVTVAVRLWVSGRRPLRSRRHTHAPCGISVSAEKRTQRDQA